MQPQPQTLGPVQDLRCWCSADAVSNTHRGAAAIVVLAVRSSFSRKYKLDACPTRCWPGHPLDAFKLGSSCRSDAATSVSAFIRRSLLRLRCEVLHPQRLLPELLQADGAEGGGCPDLRGYVRR